MTETSSSNNEAFAAAIALLSRREHGAVELSDKLFSKGHAAEDVQYAIAACQRLALQSDQRYAEMLLRARIRQGYGPERIRREIQQKKIERDIYEQALLEVSVDWVDCAKQVLRKKYKSCKPESWLLQQKQKQFLLYRGFPVHLIAQLFAERID